MANLTIKNLSDEVYSELKRSAAANKRSITAQATVLLERGLMLGGRTEQEILADSRSVRERTPVYLTEDVLRSAIDEGRR